MKWPETLTLVRHAESTYNRLKADKAEDALYRDFKKAHNKDSQSEVTRQLALEVVDRFALKLGDHNTPLAGGAVEQAEAMAGKLQDIIAVPDVIFVSPYERTHETLRAMVRRWPALGDVRQIEEERIREQDHGLSLIYTDWRVFQTLHPEQKTLRNLQGPYWYRYPQGENIPDVRERLRSWLGTLTRDFREKGVLAVTHHLAILALRANLERLDAKQFVRLDEQEKPINSGVTIYRGDPSQGTDGKLVLDAYNVKLY